MDESDTQSERVGRYRVVARHDREGARLRLRLDASVLLRLAPDPERPGQSRLEIAGVVDDAAEAGREATRGAAVVSPDAMAKRRADEARGAKPKPWRVAACVLLGASGVAAALAAAWSFFAAHDASRRSEAPLVGHGGPRPSETRVAPRTGAAPPPRAGNRDAGVAAPKSSSPSAPMPAPAVIRLQPSARPSAPTSPPPSNALPSIAPPTPLTQPSAAAPTVQRLGAPTAPERRAAPPTQQERATPPEPHIAAPSARPRERAVQPAASDGVPAPSALPAAPSGLELFDDTQ